MIGVFAKRVNIESAAILQLACVAIVAWIIIFVQGGELQITAQALFWPVAIGMGMATAFLQIAMNWAQRTVSPTRATLIYSSEPVWAGSIGWLAGERLGAVAVIGCALILVGVLVSEWRPPRGSP